MQRRHIGAQSLTNEQKDGYAFIDSVWGSGRIALVSAQLDDQQVGVISLVTRERGTDDYLIVPMAIVVDSTIGARLINSDGEALVSAQDNNEPLTREASDS